MAVKIVFMGTPQPAAIALERIVSDGHEIVGVYTQPDRPSGRGKKITFSPVKTLAMELGIEVVQPEKVRTPDAIEKFASFAADVAVVVAYGRILPQSFLDAFRCGAINVHFSLLPKYRGAAPVNWAIANCETETGVTTMRMDAGLDTGDILMQRRVTIGKDETAAELMLRLAGCGAELLSETLASIDSITAIEQNHELATLAPIMKKSDGAINWELPAGELTCRIRAFQPFPGSFTTFRGGGLKIWNAAAASNGFGTVPGEIVVVERERMVVGCGSNTQLSILELQPEGKSRLSVHDFINGFRPTVGERLGN